MAQLQNLVITDRQATPNNFTLTPDGERDGVGSVAAADSTGVTLSKKRLTLSRRISGKRVKFTEKWAFPTMVTETINGVSAPKVARVAYVDIFFTFEDSHSEQERNDVVGYIYSAHAPTKLLIHDTIVKDTSVY